MGKSKMFQTTNQVSINTSNKNIILWELRLLDTSWYWSQLRPFFGGIGSYCFLSIMWLGNSIHSSERAPHLNHLIDTHSSVAPPTNRRTHQNPESFQLIISLRQFLAWFRLGRLWNNLLWIAVAIRPGGYEPILFDYTGGHLPPTGRAW